MKKIICLAMLFIMFMVPAEAAANEYGRYERKEILSYVKQSAVIAILKEDVYLYDEPDKNSKVSFSADKDTELEIVRDKTEKWYYVKDLLTSQTGWVEGSYLYIPADPETNEEKMSAEMAEAFINEMDFESGTNFFVWTDIDRQLTHVFTGEKNNWKLYVSFDCATGMNVSPTTRGFFTIKDRGQWFYAYRFKSGARYWVRFNETYLFHSVSMDKNKNIIDPKLGERRSNGCVRLSLQDSKWFYENVPDGTKVFIH